MWNVECRMWDVGCGVQDKNTTPTYILHPTTFNSVTFLHHFFALLFYMHYNSAVR